MGADHDVEYGLSDRRQVRQHGPEVPARRPAAQEPTSPVPARMLHLQRTVGNRAAGQAVAGSTLTVQRAPDTVTAADAAARADAAAGEAKQARTDAAAADQHAGSAAKQAADAMARANAAMDEAKLASLRTVATGRINLAFTEYVSACKDVRDSIKAAAKQNAEMMAMVLDIAMGFATPGLAKWVVGFANRIPVAASNTAYRVAMAALDSDRVKAVLGGMTKAANQALKSNSMALAGETDVDAFVGALETRTHQAFEMIIDSLPGKNAVEVGIITAAFHSSVTNHDAYRKEIKELCDLYQRDVSPIGEVPMIGAASMGGAGNVQFPPEAVWVRTGGAKRLAIVTYQPGLLGIWGNKYLLDDWVDPRMQQLAIAKQTSKFGRIDEIDQSELRVIKP